MTHRATSLRKRTLEVESRKREKRVAIEEQHGQVRQLSKDGKWLVPPSERPKGWERMGLKEK